MYENISQCQENQASLQALLHRSLPPVVRTPCILQGRMHAQETVSEDIVYDGLFRDSSGYLFTCLFINSQGVSEFDFARLRLVEDHKGM